MGINQGKGCLSVNRFLVNRVTSIRVNQPNALDLFPIPPFRFSLVWSGVGYKIDFESETVYCNIVWEETVC